MAEGDIATQIFFACDAAKRGYLQLEDLSKACPELSQDELRYIFDKLDTNKDGKVSRQEFMNGFETVLACGEKSGYKDFKKRASLTSPVLKKPEILYHFEEDSALDHIPCQDDLLSLYEQLQQSGVPQILNQFERVIAAFCKEVKDQREQTERLQRIYESQKHTYNEQINEVESELDQHVAAARVQEREKLEKEKDEMRDRLEQEIRELQNNIKRLQKMESVLSEGSDKAQLVQEMKSKLQNNIKRLHKMEFVLSEGSSKAQLVQEMKSKLQDLMSENRQLKSGLTEKHTEIALIKAKLVQLRNEYDDKCTDLLTEKETLIAYIQEQDNLTRQLQLLYDANKKLHDTNDSLRTALETRRAFCKQNNLRTPSPISPSHSSLHSRQASFASSGGSSRRARPSSATGPDVKRTPLPSNRPTTPHRLTAWRNDSIDETDDDSGLARNSDTTCGSHLETELTSPSRRNDGELESEFSSLEEETAFCTTDTDTLPTAELVHPYAPPPVQKRSSASSATVTNDLEPRNRRGILKQQDSDPVGPPERTFRVVLAGDASVGKSSLIMRLVKNKFMPSLPSTLGVDFHVKLLNVDGRNVAIQLWDTAGQERFRSLCKSYFRRADGAMLVYDCTSEQSFLNVRHWIDAIQESIPKKIPVLLCGNKVDLRVSAAAEGIRCVKRNDGEKIGKLLNAIFLETSAKDGTNVKHAAVELARELLACEDSEVRSTNVVLRQPTLSSTRSCCNK